MGGRDEPDVDAMTFLGAERRDDSILQEAEELDLKGGRDVADLVEKERAAVGAGECAAPVLAGIGKRSPGRAEQLVLEECVGGWRRS